jgi:hypothetical protein
MDWASWLIWLVLFVGIGISAYVIRQRGSVQINIWVLSHDLPAYHLITETDVATTTVALADLPADALSVGISPLSYYTHKPMKTSRVLRQGDLVASNDPALTLDTVPISIPATAAMTFNGHLSSGMVVTVWAIFPSDDPVINRTELLLRHALVLDVELAQTRGKTENSSFVVILAIPQDHQAEILADSASGSLSFTLAP